MLTFKCPPGFKLAPGHYRKDGGEGYASVMAANIQIHKNHYPNARIEKFIFWDGSIFGKYSKPAPRFALILPLT